MNQAADIIGREPLRAPQRLAVPLRAVRTHRSASGGRSETRFRRLSVTERKGLSCRSVTYRTRAQGGMQGLRRGMAVSGPTLSDMGCGFSKYRAHTSYSGSRKDEILHCEQRTDRWGLKPSHLKGSYHDKRDPLANPDPPDRGYPRPRLPC